MSYREPEIIEIDDWRVLSDAEVTPVAEDEEPQPQYPNPVFVGEMRSAGPGCCFGFSLTVLVIVLIFLLGLCAACWLILNALGWLF